ncbi:MAG TPA: hypothetical protein VI703_05090 [Anaerolineales bacterium]|nr:hypothetical protein [Anaerolineales bacterium]
MSIEEFFRNLESKENSVRKVIGQVLSTRSVIGFLVEALFARDERVRYESAGLLRLIAGISPQLLYPHFNSLRDALDSKDSLLRGDIFNILKHISQVDSQRKLRLLAEDYGFKPAL